MNREIKFRGKRTDNDEWVFGGYMKNKNGIYITDTDSFHLNKTYKNYLVIPETVGQFTGLCDKNGVEIYEGDIIRLDDEYRKLISSLDENLCGRDCLVDFRDGSFMFGRNRYNPNVLDSYLWLSSEHCEVIGNIYEVENEV